MCLLRLAAYGAQDVYLSDNPQITFFKTRYRWHTNFDIDSAFEVAAAKKIQAAWRRHCANKKRKAVAVIERHVLHYLYKPGGRLAPVRFSDEKKKALLSKLEQPGKERVLINMANMHNIYRAVPKPALQGPTSSDVSSSSPGQPVPASRDGALKALRHSALIPGWRMRCPDVSQPQV